MRFAARPPAGLVLLAAVLFSGLASSDDPHPQLAEPLFVERFESFRDAGYDPLTTPVEWYRPTETVRGATVVPRVPDTVSPAMRTLSSTALEAAAAYADTQNSTALLVWHDGALQFERYWRGAGRESFFNPQSMAKSLLGMVVGIAIADGHIDSVDDPVGKYIAEWRNDPRGRITIEQLLQMSSGLAQISDSYDISLDNPAVYQHFGTDFIAPILELPQADPPGSRWDYNNNETNLLGAIVERATGERYADYLSRKLWQPLGLADARLYLDREGGTPMVSCCVLSRPLDWLRLGILFLNDGRHEGRQLVPADWIAAMQTPAATNAGYGYQVWLGDHAVAPERPLPTYANQPFSSEPYLDPDTVVFRGFGYQRVWILPTKRLVIVRAGASWPPDWDNTVIPNTIYRGTPQR